MSSEVVAEIYTGEDATAMPQTGKKCVVWVGFPLSVNATQEAEAGG